MRRFDVEPMAAPRVEEPMWQLVAVLLLGIVAIAALLLVGGPAL